MSAPWTPSKRSLARVSSMGSSFASCFGASTPISPCRLGGHGLLDGHAYVNYRRLEFDGDEDEDKDAHIYEATAQEELGKANERYGHVFQRREDPFLQLGTHSTVRESRVLYGSEGEEQHGAERKTVMSKLGSRWTKREKAGMQVYHAPETPKVEEPYIVSEQGGNEHYVRQRKSIRKLAKLWSVREKDTISYVAETPKKQEQYHAADQEEEEAGTVYVREKKGVLKLAKLWIMREAAKKGVYKEGQSASSDEETDEYGGERGDLSMREKEGMCAGRSPRRGSLSRKVREACVQVLESARRSSPHLSELFVGNQLLMQVTSPYYSARRARIVPPSTAFHVAGDLHPSVVSTPCSSSSSVF